MLLKVAQLGKIKEMKVEIKKKLTVPKKQFYGKSLIIQRRLKVD